ncbi:hypothetical protein FGB62_22g855 [Gracilaria domingensis]|nr:hypothetical protein FGB62_22g855 [Gracilaria domingensis]
MAASRPILRTTSVSGVANSGLIQPKNESDGGGVQIASMIENVWNSGAQNAKEETEDDGNSNGNAEPTKKTARLAVERHGGMETERQSRRERQLQAAAARLLFRAGVGGTTNLWQRHGTGSSRAGAAAGGGPKVLDER